jgi:predicted NAD-dependent protein-ADP-ribosyltransferase YbiA (DUF1768 family)
MPPTKTKAAAIDYCVGLAKNFHQKDGSWFNAEEMETLVAGGLCALPSVFQGIKKEDSFLADAQIQKAKKTLRKTYDSLFSEDAFSCYKDHYVTFYSARGDSILAEGSQMAQFKITLENFDYQSNEKYYQIQKVIAMTRLTRDPQFPGYKVVKVREKPESISDADWKKIGHDTICEDLVNLMTVPKCTGKRARELSTCMSFTVSGEGKNEATLRLFDERFKETIAHILLNGNWEKFNHSTYKAMLMMTGTKIILEACPDTCHCRCGIGCHTLDFARSKKKAAWRDNLLGKTLMAIRHAFFDEERTGELVKPSMEDVLNAWDWRQPIKPKNCLMCRLTKKRGMLPYPGCYPKNSSDFYEQEATI